MQRRNGRLSTNPQGSRPSKEAPSDNSPMCRPASSWRIASVPPGQHLLHFEHLSIAVGDDRLGPLLERLVILAPIVLVGRPCSLIHQLQRNKAQCGDIQAHRVDTAREIGMTGAPPVRGESVFASPRGQLTMSPDNGDVQETDSRRHVRSALTCPSGFDFRRGAESCLRTPSTVKEIVLLREVLDLSGHYRATAGSATKKSSSAHYAPTFSLVLDCVQFLECPTGRSSSSQASATECR
jgi:hypothetical protein